MSPMEEEGMTSTFIILDTSSVFLTNFLVYVSHKTLAKFWARIILASRESRYEVECIVLRSKFRLGQYV